MQAVISVTTIPDRIGRIGPCLKSLVAQGLPVYLWAVPKIARSETRLELVPKFEGVNVELVADRGPLTKFLPAFERGFDIIITADDDCIYGPGWANRLLSWSKKLPGSAIGYRGRKLRGPHYVKALPVFRDVKRPTSVDIITGTHGALYRSELFEESISNEWKLWPENDDLVITAHLQRLGVPRYVVPGSCKITPTAYCRRDSLFENNRTQAGNDRGMKVLGIRSGL